MIMIITMTNGKPRPRLESTTPAVRNPEVAVPGGVSGSGGEGQNCLVTLTAVLQHYVQ